MIGTRTAAVHTAPPGAAGEASRLPAWSAPGAAPGAAPAAAVWGPLAGHAGDGPDVWLFVVASWPTVYRWMPGCPGHVTALLRGSAAHWPALCWINQAPGSIKLPARLMIWRGIDKVELPSFGKGRKPPRKHQDLEVYYPERRIFHPVPPAARAGRFAARRQFWSAWSS